MISSKSKLSSPPDFHSYKAWLIGSRQTKESTQGETAIDNGVNASPNPTAATSLESQATKTNELTSHSDSVVSPNIPIDDTSIPSKQQQQPTYPSSFAHIVELITTGQPVPGIQQIPDTVLTGHDTSSSKQKRRKPWEKDDS